MFITKKDCKFPKREQKAHKGQSGKLLIIGGTELFVGAPILAAMAAFRSGVDIVEIAAPKKVAYTINSYNASIITHKLNGKSFSKKHTQTILTIAKNVDAVLIGNGLGRNPQQKSFVYDLLKQLDKPLVIDADALHATFLDKIKSKNVILTPHQKEFEVFEKNNNNFKLKVNQVIIKKGNIDNIITKNKILKNKTGVPEMAVAGTGDVLAGLAAGFLAQHIEPKQAAINATYLNGKAGELAKKNFGNFTAEELLNFLKIN